MGLEIFPLIWPSLSYFFADLAALMVLDDHLPLSGDVKIRALLHALHTVVEGDVLTELVVVGVEVEVALEVFVAHEVGEFPWDGEVAVARHFLARVDDARVVQARLPFFYFFSGTETGRYLMTVCISLNCKHRFSLLVLKIVSKKLLARFLKGK